MKQNIGTINALIRITAGFTLLAWATSRLVRRPYHSMPLLGAMMGAMTVGEGILKYCPFTDLIERQAQTNGRQQNTSIPNSEYRENYTEKVSNQSPF